MRADSVMARGAFRLPNTSGPVPLKSNTALPCPSEGEGRGEVVSSQAATPPKQEEAPPPLPDLT